MKVWSWNTVSTPYVFCIGSLRRQEVLRVNDSMGRLPVKWNSGLRKIEKGRR